LVRAFASLGYRSIFINPHLGREFESTPLFDRQHRLAELEPNDEPESATKILVPSVINGRFAKPKDRDYYEFEASKDQRLVFSGKTRSLGSPCEVFMRLEKADGGKVADARVTYIKLTPEQVEAQKRFGFASENIKVRSKLGTTFSNHGMTIPQLMFLKLSNEIAIETDLTFAKQ